MNPDAICLIALVLAALPAGLFHLNLLVYRPLPGRSRDEEDRSAQRRKLAPSYPPSSDISVLIPARNEEQNIRATLDAVLASRGCDFEVIVLDDHSTDHTARIVSELAVRDPRVRLASAPSLPAGWCGKQHACHVLAGLACHPLLLFIDADVRLEPNALARMGTFMNATDTALASGVPRQELVTFSERLLIPLIHFILLGFLPIRMMRRTQWPSMSAGCGQLFIARRDEYLKTGGHAAIRNTLHDGLKLPRLFRRHGFRTDLFDATDLAECRMYHTNGETWCGLGKNATEGLAAPGLILPMTTLLVGGQVLPFALLFFASDLSTMGFAFALAACFLAYAPRLSGVWRFRQTLGSALLHPFGIVALLAIQWFALGRRFAGKPSVWKGRNYHPSAVVGTARSA